MTPAEIERILAKAHEEMRPPQHNRWETLIIYALGFVLGFAASALAHWWIR
jgi:hypothetical protein